MFQLPEAAFAVLRDLRDPLLLGALERLQLRSRKPLAGQLLGSHRSRRHGSSLDFADFRDYQPGDDFRRIDYLTLARLDQLVIRLYEAEDDITVRLMVDCSASMRLDQKLQRAAELAGAIGFVALTRRDRVEVHVSGRPPARFRGRTGVGPLFDFLETLRADGQGSLATASSTLLHQQKSPGMTVLCSDLLEPQWEPALRTLPARGDHVTVVHTLGIGELEPPRLGDIDLVDAETGNRVAVTLTPQSIDAYRVRLSTWLDQVESASKKIGASYLLADTRQTLRSTILGELGGVLS